MSNFAWVPFPDPQWSAHVRSMDSKIKILPHNDETSNPQTDYGVTVSWKEIKAEDTLFIAAHGRRFSTETVAWNDGKGGVRQWTADNLAGALCDKLGESRYLSLDYRLLACFGANNITPLAKSFGSRLAARMKTRKMKGTLTAYRGVTGIGGLNAGLQEGSSRVTYALGQLFHIKRITKTDDAAEVWNLS